MSEVIDDSSKYRAVVSEDTQKPNVHFIHYRLPGQALLPPDVQSQTPVDIALSDTREEMIERGERLKTKYSIK